MAAPRPVGLALPAPRTVAVWSEHWLDPEQRLAIIEEGLRGDGLAPESAASSTAGTSRSAAASSAAPGCAWPSRSTAAAGSSAASASGRRIARLGIVLLLLLAAGALVAGIDGDVAAASVLGALAVVLLVLELDGAARATAALRHAVERQRELADYELATDLAAARAPCAHRRSHLSGDSPAAAR